MPTQEYCVYNETRESLLIPRVTVIDTKSEPLKAVKVLIEGLAPNADSGLWLNPLERVPTVPRLSSYDLVYLVADNDVPPFDGEAASALVLPIHTFSLSHAHPGDKVVLRTADENEHRAVDVAVEASAVLKAAGFYPERSMALMRLDSPVPSATPINVDSFDQPNRSIPADKNGHRAVEVAAVAPPAMQPAGSHSERSTALMRLDSPVLCATPMDVDSLDRPNRSSTAAVKRAASTIGFLRSIVQLRIHISVTITTTLPAQTPVPAELDSPGCQSDFRPSGLNLCHHCVQTAGGLPTLVRGGSHAILESAASLAAGAASATRSRFASSAASVARCCRSLKLGYLRWAEAFVYGAPHVSARSAVHRSPRFEEEC
jgi:hypothetical protein